MSLTHRHSAAHQPVLWREVTAHLAPRNGETYIDATLGRAGHSRAILEQAPKARVIGIDRDPQAIDAVAAQKIPQLSLHLGRFAEMERLSEAVRDGGLVDGILLDLGVSSPQLDEACRGFSFQQDGPLDMRMDPSSGEPAASLVNRLPEQELADLLFTYGEERRSRRIARAIVARRAEQPFSRTAELAALIRQQIGKPEERIDPATRSFQALRIAVNQELEELVAGLNAAERLLKPGGRLVVIAFHSLEDALVKRFLKARSGQAGGAVSRYAPPLPPTAAVPLTFEIVTKRPLTAAEDEIRTNRRARSARLRIAKRSAAAPAAQPWSP